MAVKRGEVRENAPKILELRKAGKSLGDISKLLGLSNASVCRVLYNPEFAKERSQFGTAEHQPRRKWANAQSHQQEETAAVEPPKPTAKPGSNGTGIGETIIRFPNCQCEVAIEDGRWVLKSEGESVEVSIDDAKAVERCAELLKKFGCRVFKSA